eukprot:CAMPEP_0198258594 /NCGR_PEP_ID=MMETSP1447-20131203/7967_1 /TAXON_ID=420782 /ORGANISM="Chaetoceros dichaeta, Strain CCMP1751" /LENGTH=83 /DNA_ID=CAMNT_0043945747 /DNA_START=57 /DNA_END=308 /DNA_ORIENTATION=+
MKLAVAAIIIASAAAFAPVSQPAFKLNALSAIVTGQGGSAAASKEEDLELTREIILNYISTDDEGVESEDTPAPAPPAPEAAE